jgi:uncharacterized protein
MKTKGKEAGNGNTLFTDQFYGINMDNKKQKLDQKDRSVSGVWLKSINTLKYIALYLLIAMMSLACEKENAFYQNNREPLLETKYVKLPLGAVKPQGWLRDQLIVQANGYTGHLHEVWDVMKTSAWKGDSGANVLPECCYARFVPRWLEGLIPLAYQLDDNKLKMLADEYMAYLLTVEDPAIVTPSLTGWSHLGRVLPAYYEVTQDERVVELCGRMLDYFKMAYSDSLTRKNRRVIQVPRLPMALTFSWWYYNLTGDKEVLNTVELFSKDLVNYWTDYFNDPVSNPEHHVVNVAQAIQYPVMYYLMSKDEKHKNSVFNGMDKLDRLHGQVTGRWNGDEWLSGLSPTQGSELCSVTELVYCLVKNFEALGDPVFADRLESLMFNAVPGTCTGDWWAHQYDQQANQVLVSVDNRPWNGNDETSNIFGFTPNYPCCLSNMHSPFPNYIQYMWLATSDKGLVASSYGPCEVKAKVGNGMEVTIKEETNYPFSDKVSFTINCPEQVSFPIYFRIPSWSESAELSVSGDKKVLHPQKGSIVKVERKWKSGDVITLSFNAKVRTERRMNNSAAVMWGPLYFSLRIGQSFKKIDIKEDRRAYPDYSTGVANWHIEPTTDWNYALLDPDNMEYEIVTNKISSIPFARAGEPVWLPGATELVPWGEDVPVILKVKARKINNWRMNGVGNADAVPVSSRVFSYLPPKGETEVVELIPYGCTRLRISEFPVIESSHFVGY